MYRSGVTWQGQHLVHANIQRVVRFCVNLEFDFRGRQLESTALCALGAQQARDGIHAPQVHTDLVLQPVIIYPGLRLCIRQRRPAPAGSFESQTCLDLMVRQDHQERLTSQRLCEKGYAALCRATPHV